ncbi:MAG TPA: hypothetical protein PK878_18545, partial [bacterium]|nr:hypothetical protein [bacterium]
MMQGNRIWAILVGFAFLFPLAAYTQSDLQVGKNIEALLQQILENQEQMRADIEMLKQKLAVKDEEIASLRKTIQQQQETVQEQAKVIEKQAETVAAGGGDLYGARVQYEVARQLMHDTIFKVRKGEQKPWFERTVAEFRKVVDNYPNAPEAPEAQIRIARIYRRYLDNT